MQSERPDLNRRLDLTAHALSRPERRSEIAAAADCGARRKTEKLLLTTHLVSLLSILTHFFILFIPIASISKFFY